MNNINNSQVLRSRKLRRKLASDRPPAVDSALLRFIKMQKESFDQQRCDADFTMVELDTTAIPQEQQEDYNMSPLETLPFHQLSSSGSKATITSDDNNTPVVNGEARPVVVVDDDALAGQAQQQEYQQKQQNQQGEKQVLASSWWGQYNSHRIETVLFSLDDTLDSLAVQKAGARVQAQVLARTVRRRIRSFLKERDLTWQSDLASTSTIGSVSEMIGFAGGHSFEDSVQVMMEHGLTPKDITDILQHSPGIVLMRPRDSTNGECLYDTIDRVFKLLCVTLKLRKYDARKIVRASPSLLTMRGSKSAEAVVSLLSHLGISHNAVARDKALLTEFLSRSPAAIFRLVAFLAGDAIRMPVSKIGPLLRRRLSQELLDAVAPVSQQISTHGSSCSATTANIALNHTSAENNGKDEAVVEEDELDPWIVSALWGKQSQIRRDRINRIYQNMTRTAWTLRNEVGTADLSKVVAAYPSVLLLDAHDQILPNAEYLMDSLGICKGDLSRVLQLYPSLLGLPIERMQAMANALRSLGVSPAELTSVLRSFPAILSLDIKENVVPVVRFLRSIGVIDIGRFVTRLPPVLGYSVEGELIPKWRYLQSVAFDPRFEVTKFPAYFSYPFDRVIKARYEYIRDVKKYPTQLISVEKVLSYGDRDFAVHVMKEEDEGEAFQRFQENRIEVQRPNKKNMKRNNKNQPNPQQS
ncbi:hypothetical protein ACA910_006004 [Epithemia clementina (nom. ined.)]